MKLDAEWITKQGSDSIEAEDRLPTGALTHRPERATVIMKSQCKHNSIARKEGLCSACAQLKPWTVFRWNPDCRKTGTDDKCCGYFYGPGHKDEGKKCAF